MAKSAIRNVSLPPIVIEIIILWLFAKSAGSARIDRSSSGQFHGSGTGIGERLGFVNSGCHSLEMESLAKILGPAYNPRYMSVIPPRDASEDADSSDIKRKASDFNQFSVDGDFAQEVEEKPAWEVDHFMQSAASEKRQKRAAAATPLRPWECQAVVKWIDLGSDYFPRYLRSVECTKHDCWYDKFVCKARSFTVKLLRRKKGKCVYQNQSRREGNVGLPQELKELWVWEERAVNFCCDCAPP